jgi:hypothetical protein
LLIAAVVVTLSGMSVDAPPFTPLVPQPDYIVLSFIEVSRVERRPIAADDVQLPPTLPALDWWSTDLPSFDSPSTPDHETVMELSGDSPDATKSIRTIRRLGPWQLLDETIGARRDITLTHDSPDAVSIRQRSIRRAEVPDHHKTRCHLDFIGAQIRIAHDRFEPLGNDPRRVLPLVRYDAWPYDAWPCGRWPPLMPDQRRHRAQGGCLGTRHAQTRMDRCPLARRPIRLDEIKPPVELLDLHLWGLD